MIGHKLQRVPIAGRQKAFPLLRGGLRQRPENIVRLKAFFFNQRVAHQRQKLLKDGHLL